jgi:mono/diheme cytochrome c family protein
MDVRALSMVRTLFVYAAIGSGVAACSGSSLSGSSPAHPANATVPGGYESHILAGSTPPTGAVLIESQGRGAAAAKAGASLFIAMNCDGCHGGDAGGWIAPSLVDGRWRYGGSDQEIFSSIYYGRPKGMPAFGGVLGREGAWNVVAYLESASVRANEATESWE